MDRSANELYEESALWLTLGSMLSVGVPVLDALDYLRKEYPWFSPVLVHMHEKIRDGVSIHESINKYKHQFSPWVVGLVAAGEKNGMVHEALLRAGELAVKCAKVQSTSGPYAHLRPTIYNQFSKATDFALLSMAITDEHDIVAGLRLVCRYSASDQKTIEDWYQVAQAVETGKSLSCAMSNYPHTWAPFIVKMIDETEKRYDDGGESLGLTVVLSRIATMLEQLILLF